MKKDEYITITKESYQQMNCLLIERAKEIERLQKQLDEANTVILSLPAEKISTCMIACEYLDKWGVK